MADCFFQTEREEGEKVNLRIECTLLTHICGHVPELDSILEYQSAFHNGLQEKIVKENPLSGIDIPIPLIRRSLGGLNIPLSSSPIFRIEYESIEFLNKSVDQKHLHLLGKPARFDIASGQYKSYRLPKRILQIPRVVWFASGNRKGILDLLKGVTSLGELRKNGYGRVHSWIVTPCDNDFSFFAENVLMRRLPFCEDLPTHLKGYKRSFGACLPPYWHPDRFTEIVVPC